MAIVGRVGATHLRAGEIIAERVNCQSLTFRITITVYTNTGSSVLFGGRQGEEDILDFGDGLSMLVPETPNTVRNDLGSGIGTASFTVFHTYSSPGRYTISYREPNRNEGVLNMDNSVNTRFYIETRINIDPFLGCNNTPQLLVAPIDRGCTGAAFFHNPGAFDPDGDSLSYEMVIPFSDRDLPVIRYQDPASNTPRQFYINYNTANEEANGQPTFSINPITGTLLWDAPGAQGEYNIAFIVKEWRKNRDGQWVELGYVRRDMQIVVEDCNNERPDLIIPQDTCIEAGTVLRATIFGIDPENHPVKIEAFSEIFNFAPAQSPATYSPTPAYRPSNPPAELEFEWNTQCLHVKDQPYQVVFKITDDPPNDINLVTFKTWNITVVGPKPVWQAPPVSSGGSVTLDWEDYICANAERVQIWRKVDSFPYTPANCETGMPEFLGYENIAEIPLRDGNNPISTYVDSNKGKGLAPGATYCYRLVAVFPLPKGGESYMSEEVCVTIKADAPIITHVTVDRTDAAQGEIRVSWKPPFEADEPPPYTYEVLRAEGFTGQIGLTSVGTTADTTFLDTGLNTLDKVYNYQIICRKGSTVIDTSKVASSVRLEARSQLQLIELNWSAFVPWSNQTASYPEHLVYRGPEGATENDMVLLGSVNVTLNGLVYIDEGLEDDQVYCYRVMTRGSYGSPSIEAPLENFSQIICAQPSDSIPPCKPVLNVQLTDCEKFFREAPCSQSVFNNTLFWSRPEGECGDDIRGYKIYRSASADGNFIWLTNAGNGGIVLDTFYIDDGLNKAGLSSMAYCYRIVAVDRSGNESEMSDPVCNDNCPYYELPNVFTPNNDGCNDVFSAFNNRPIQVGEGGNLSACPELPESSRIRCARFVNDVSFKVYNRWGKEVFSYESGSERTIYIDWNGRDNEGRELSTGIYYYIAEVTFDSSNPAKRNQTFKGWVHLLR